MPLGMSGVSAAGATLFFSYIGFDAASTAGEEAKNAQRDLPRAIMLSLVIVTALYVLVAAVAVGAKPWQKFNDSEAALAQIMRDVTGQSFWGTLLAFCAVIAIASVVLTVLYGQTRILFAMSRDGLVPKVFSRVHPKSGAPRANTVIVSLFCGVLAAAIPLGQLADAPASAPCSPSLWSTWPWWCCAGPARTCTAVSGCRCRRCCPRWASCSASG